MNVGQKREESTIELESKFQQIPQFTEMWGELFNCPQKRMEVNLHKRFNALNKHSKKTVFLSIILLAFSSHLLAQIQGTLEKSDKFINY